jgi:hypothetical protein
MKPHCRLCRRPVVAGSSFCEEHLQQAKVFSATFAAPEGDAESAEAPTATESGDAPSAARPASAPPRQRRGTVATTTGKFALEEVVFAPNDLSAAALAYRLERLFEQVRARAAGHAERDANRWPQLSVYTLHDKLLARAYYTIIPAAQGGEGAGPSATAVPTYELDAAALSEALGPQGVVFEALAHAFAENKAALLARQVQTLDVHLMTYAGLVAITKHLANQRDEQVATFVFEGGAFKSVAAAEVTGRLRHDRWS